MFARRLALAIAVLAGLIGSQGPEFAQQYRQRLGGALEELNRIVAEFDAEARGENLTRAEALGRLERNDDPLARERGEDMRKAIDRDRRLSEQIEAMNSAGPLMRLYLVATNFDPRIARSTLDNYEPAEPLSFGALAAGGLAALWGWAATLLIAWPFRRRSRLLRRARAQSQGAEPLIGGRSGEIEGGGVGGDHRGGHSSEGEAVAIRVGDRQAGRATYGVGQHGREVLSLRHARSQIGERRRRQINGVRTCARNREAVDRFGAEAGAEDELLAAAGGRVDGLRWDDS